MHKIFCLLCCLMIIAAASNCSSDALKPSAYIQYVKNRNNGFVQHHVLPGGFIETLYQPSEYFALMQLTPEELNDSLLAKEIKQHDQFYYFDVMIGSNSDQTVDDMLKKAVDGKQEIFDKKKERMLYGMQHDFSLVLGQDSLPCVFFLAQQQGKIDNAYHFILAFELDSTQLQLSQNNDFTLVLQDTSWFNKRFEFAFDQQKINQSPKLKL
jgi:hypothetical protein